jgi:hypothetical protein
MGKVYPGSRNPNWKGGRVVDPRGYVLIRVGTDHPLADVRGYAYEHRLIAHKNGHDIAGKHVHHDDETKGNNDPSNLEPLTPHEHRAKHRKLASRGLRNPGEDNPVVACKCGCGGQFSKYDGSGRPRHFLSGHNPRESPTLDAVIQVLSEATHPLSRKEISSVLPELSFQAIVVMLSKLRRSGKAEPAARGRWKLTRKTI